MPARGVRLEAGPALGAVGLGGARRVSAWVGFWAVWVSALTGNFLTFHFLRKSESPCCHSVLGGVTVKCGQES